MEKEKTIADKKFYLVMAIAGAALLIGTAGLMISLIGSFGVGSPVSSPNSNSRVYSSKDSLPNNGSTQMTPDGAINRIAP